MMIWFNDGFGDVVCVKICDVRERDKDRCLWL